MVIFRIDNGWDIDPKENLEAVSIFMTGEKRRYLEPLRQLILSTEVQTTILKTRLQTPFTNVEQLFDLVKHHIHEAKIEGFRTACRSASIYRFTVWLRWCNDSNYLFR